MPNQPRCLIAGGDSRFVRLGGLLSRGFQVFYIGGDEGLSTPSRNICFLPALSLLKDQPDLIVLPVPVTQDGESVFAPLGNEKILLSHILDTAHSGTVVCGGLVSPEVERMARDRSLPLYDYARREEFAILGALPTAEGALSLALSLTGDTLTGKRVLLTGYGKVARLCHRVFERMGCPVTVGARRGTDRLWAEAFGAKAAPLTELERLVGEADVILNTVPALLFDRKVLSSVPAGCLLLDLASKPGGTDFEAARELGVRAVPALSLPGKLSPDAAALALYRTIQTILSERGETYA